MGASGSGKTTLLNVINFRNRGSLKIDGQVRINGQLVNSIEEIASISGYVQQDDLFCGSLTVKENLIFQVFHISINFLNSYCRFSRYYFKQGNA
jgi:ABC-type multidrug transport system ATPase subunit